jgi:UDP-3-O-[3-hydroxymyristoyl] glucosamine N-acyltransferase
MVTRSLEKPGMYSSVMPVEEARLWRRLVGRFKRLDLLAGRVRILEAAGPGATTRQDDDN